MMNKNGEVISNVFNDKNINKDERYMFLMFISMMEEAKEEITISIRTLMSSFQTKCKKKVVGILKSLELKGYIKIIKSIGKTNKYKVIKNYVNNIINNFDHSKKEDQYSNESCNTGDFYSQNNSNTKKPGNDISSGNLGTSSNISSGNLDTSIYLGSGNLDTGSNITGACNDTGSYIEPSYNCYEEYAGHEENSGFDTGLFCLEDYYNLNNTRLNNYNLNNINKKNNNNIYNNNLYLNIFNTWNEAGVNKEKILYPSIKSAIEYALNFYQEDEIISAIRNYSEIYYSDYYYDHNWSLERFLRKENGVKRFLNSGDIWRNYSRKLEKEREEEKFKINIEDYID